MMLVVRIARNVKLGLGSLKAHMLRSVLTTLGIVFGVASVVCMLAIGEGLSYEAREQIRRLGSNNIILRTVKPPREKTGTENVREVPAYGLTYKDIERIEATIPRVTVIVPTREMRKDIWLDERSVEGHIVGTVPWFPRTSNRKMLRGRFINSMDMYGALNVCVLSESAARKLGSIDSPIGKVVRASGDDVFTVIGIIENAAPVPGMSTDSMSSTQDEVFIPLTASRARFGDLIMERRAGSMTFERVELHGAVVRVHQSDDVLQTSAAVEVLLNRFHDKKDYEMIVPLQLLREKERVKRLYNMVLGLMAAISLVVGGIGIMNIMLATVSERTREIGIRRAIGARKRDIMAQFLTETVLLSALGGLIGVGLGIFMPWLIEHLANMKTIVTTWAVVLAFGISGLIGLFFGFYPAWRAANMDPITALRHE